MKKLLVAIMLLPMLAFAGKKPRVLELNENNTINFNDEFSAMFVASKQLEAISLCFANIGKEINIVLYTPGGSISAGQLFFDTLNALPCTFNTITIFSASMGYQTVQNLGKRYILPSGRLMSHRASISGLSGELGGELDSIISHLNTMVTEMETVAASRAGLSLENYRKEISDELWMTGEEAVTKKHADEVIVVKCGKSLLGTHIRTINSIFGQLSVEFSNCPIITAPIRIQSMRRSDAIKYESNFNNISNRIKTTL